MKRILVLGGSGQVGMALAQCAPSNVVVSAPTSAAVNVLQVESLRMAVAEYRPHVIINCAAFTRVDDAETEVQSAFAINASAPAFLAAEVARTGARLLHVSTDYVFDGSGMPPYASDAAPAPLSVYGQSKLDGERAVLMADTNALVVRTAWVHSGGGVNFVKTAVRLLRNGGTMRVVDDQVSTPTRALSLARALWAFATDHDETRGIAHFTDAGAASWFDVAECVLETLVRRNAAGAGAAVVPVDSSTFPRPATRPRVSLLDKHSTWAVLGNTPPHWREGVIASTHELLNA